MQAAWWLNLVGKDRCLAASISVKPEVVHWHATVHLAVETWGEE